MDASFRFRQFSVHHSESALKLGTDAVLLGAAMSIRGSERRALDIGTGCGVIALMAAQRAPHCHIVGIDIDPPSVREAALNFAASPWAERLEAVLCALEEFRPETGNYDLIFSNPPYYDDSLKNPDERSAAARHTHSLPHATLLPGQGAARGGRTLLRGAAQRRVFPVPPHRRFIRPVSAS